MFKKGYIVTDDMTNNSLIGKDTLSRSHLEILEEGDISSNNGGKEGNEMKPLNKDQISNMEIIL